MKQLLLILILFLFGATTHAQSDTTTVVDTNSYQIVKTDGGVLIGKILKQDEREVLLLTQDDRKIFIPQYMIESIVKLNGADFNNNGKYVGEDDFATRYFLTTNGLSFKKGDNYVQWNLFGPDFQFAVADNLSVGIMTTWIGYPIVGTIKKSCELGEDFQFAVGALVGTGSWISPSFGGALPFGTLSVGDKRRNIAITGGYGAVWADGDLTGRGLSSIAGMVKVSDKFSLVFDSFILLPVRGKTSTDVNGIVSTEPDKSGFALLIPGIRYHNQPGKAFQFGFTGVVSEGGLFPFPIPMVQWYRTL
jgi:hypothetical protein